ncbi:MAG TPA: DUF72 domain-containing protein [Thermoleophilaceae bacterium]
MAGKILVGTSSWADPGFVEEWYPPGMASRDRLPWYARRFDAVEVNSSFYAIPEPGTVARWAEVTPDDFVFDYKLHRALSRHAAQVDSLPPDMRDGLDVGPRGRVRLTATLERELVTRTLEAVAPLEQAGKLGAFLLQLTPAFSPRRHALDELAVVIEALGGRPLAIEFRHRGWVEGDRLEATLDWLTEHRVAFVSVDAPKQDEFTIMPDVDAVTRPDLAYIRLHGRNAEGYLKGKSVAERFGWDYSDDELEEVAGRARGMAEQADLVHVMFNNNRGADAPTSARKFRMLMGQDPGPPPDDGQLRIG